MKKVIAALALLLGISLPAYGRERVSGWCEQGGNKTTTGGLTSTESVQQSFPSCTITVFDSGTMDVSSIFSDDSGTVKANPFTASSTGFWFWYADDSRYDVRLSGGGIVTPFTIGDILLDDTRNDVTTIVSVASSATPTFDASLGTIFTNTLTADVTSSTISNPVTGQRITIYLAQDGAGGWTFAWPANVQLRKSIYVVADDISAVSVIKLYYDGANWRETGRDADEVGYVPTPVASGDDFGTSSLRWDLFAEDITIGATAYKFTDQTTFLQLEGDVFIFDNDSGAADFVLKRSQASGAGQGTIIRFRTRNDTEAFIDGAQINGGLEQIATGNEQGVLDFVVYVNGTPRIISVNGVLSALTPSVTGIFGLGTTGIGYTGVHLEGSAPVLRMEDTDETLPAGAWRMINDTDILQWQHNTAVGGDFTTRTIPLLITAGDDVVVNDGGLSTVDFRVEGGTDDNLLYVDAGNDRVGIGTATPASLLDVNGNSTLPVVNPLEGTLSNQPRWIFKQVDHTDMTAAGTADTFVLWTLPANTMIHDVVGTVVTAWEAAVGLSAAVCSVGTAAGAASDLTLDDDFFAVATVYELHDATASGGKGALLFDNTDKFAPFMLVASGDIEIQCDLTGDDHADTNAGQARVYILVSQPLANTTTEAN